MLGPPCGPRRPRRGISAEEKEDGGGDGNRTRVQGFAGPCLSHSATPPQERASPTAKRAASRGITNLKPRCRADDGIRTRDPHLGKVMLYQLSHVRMSVRGYTSVLPPRALRGDVRTLSHPRATTNSNRGLREKICPSNERWSLWSPLLRRSRLAGQAEPPLVLAAQRCRRPAAGALLRQRRRPGGNGEGPRCAGGAVSGGGAPIAPAVPGAFAGGFSRPVTGVRAGKSRAGRDGACYCALRMSSASSVSTSTKSVSSPDGTIA
jgi:hypothetical protein